MLTITPDNTVFFNDFNALFICLSNIDQKVKSRKDKFFYKHQIWSNELGWFLTVEVYEKSKVKYGYKAQSRRQDL
jgi:hypothetical protein